MSQQNAAQQILASIGIAVVSTVKQAHGEKNASATKAGPGRFHRAMHSKSSPPKSKGAPRGFVVHTADSEKKARRAAIARMGSFRQFRRLRSLPLRIAKV